MTKDTVQLKFHHNDGRVATIATNGTRHVVQIGTDVEEKKSLFKAIAFLEAKGFSIQTEEFKIY